MSRFVVRGPTFTRLLSPNARKNRSRSNIFPILDILTCSRDILDQSLKLYKIAHNFAGFGPPIFWGVLPNFLTCIIKRTQGSLTMIKAEILN